MRDGQRHVERTGAYQTAATTDSAATAVDQAQYDAREGPSLDAVDTPVVYAESFPDSRWPTLGSRPAEMGAQSAASYRLAAASLATPDRRIAQHVRRWSRRRSAPRRRRSGSSWLPTHRWPPGIRERGALQDLAQNLNQALLSRDVIGQAKGILMERLKISPEDAFDALRRSSNRLNEKLQAVALNLAETGEFDIKDAPNR